MHEAMSCSPMWTDVVDLRDFYATGLGQVTRRLIGARLRLFWPDVGGMRVLGLGFATPYLRVFLGEAERVIALMPASQGVLPWPAEGRGLTALGDETDLPLPDRSFDRILMVHTLESTEQVRAVMREAWRVLADGGRLVVVVPNRRGIWSRLERTPFGNGRPFTQGQLVRMLRDNMFTPLDHGSALFLPPTGSPMLLKAAPAVERLGRRWCGAFGGVLMVEAAKQIYAGAAGRERSGGRRTYLPLPQGLPRAVDPALTPRWDDPLRR